MTEPTDDELLALIEKHLGLKPRRDDTVIDPRTGRFHDVQRYRDLKADILAKWGTPTMTEKPMAFLVCTEEGDPDMVFLDPHEAQQYLEDHEQPIPLYTTQVQTGAVPLTDREVELIDGMIQVQLDHASRCDAIANRAMADKQKGWDMERVALLQKLKANGIKGGQHGTDTRSN